MKILKPCMECHAAVSDCRQTRCWDHPSTIFPFKVKLYPKILRNLRFCSFSNPFLPRNLAVFRFIHAKVSPAFISIRTFPMYCVYRNPWYSFTVKRFFLSFLFVSDRLLYSLLHQISSAFLYFSQT